MLQLADHSYVQPEGKIEDILVQVDKFIFPADFLILDCEANNDAPIILGRPFLATGRVLFDFGNEELILRVDDQQVKMALHKMENYDAEANDCWMVQTAQEFNSNQTICPDREEMQNIGSIGIETQTNLETSNWVQLRPGCLGRKIDGNTSAAQRGIRLDHCRYQGISPTICMHKILLEENHKPTVDAQRRLNQAMKDVVRNEILKLLDADWQGNNSIALLTVIQATTRLPLHLKTNPKQHSPSHTKPLLSDGCHSGCATHPPRSNDV
ncbi:hypothetical protein V6N13_130137 [Hibiscus sabdariffa]